MVHCRTVANVLRQETSNLDANASFLQSIIEVQSVDLMHNLCDVAHRTILICGSFDEWTSQDNRVNTSLNLSGGNYRYELLLIITKIIINFNKNGMLSLTYKLI